MNEVRRSTDGVEVLPRSKRDWQIWLMLILVLALIGMGLAVYGFVSKSAAGASAGDVLEFVPPLLFGVLALFLLSGFYLAQKEAVLRALREEVLTQKIEAELNRELTLLDPVTEVYNRRYARVILSREVSRVKRYGNILALMMVDVTGFRRVNDSLGHTGGDVVLRQIAHLLQSKIRNSDIIVRFGGDEFLLILPEAEKTGVERLVVRLKESLIDWAPRSGLSDFNLRFAVGVGYYTAEKRVDEILSVAEDRMLQDRGAPDPVSAAAAHTADANSSS